MKNWFLQLMLITLFGFIGIQLYAYAFPLSSLAHSAFWALIIFSVFTLILFGVIQLFLGRIGSKSVTGLMMLAIIGRLVVTASGILWYRSTFQPESNWFVFPFFIFYIIYLVFENLQLIQLGKKIGNK